MWSFVNKMPSKITFSLKHYSKPTFLLNPRVTLDFLELGQQTNKQHFQQEFLLTHFLMNFNYCQKVRGEEEGGVLKQLPRVNSIIDQSTLLTGWAELSWAVFLFLLEQYTIDGLIYSEQRSMNVWVFFFFLSLSRVCLRPCPLPFSSLTDWSDF